MDLRLAWASTVIAAISPAREAARVSPVEAMARGQREYAVRVSRGRDLAIAAVLAAAGRRRVLRARWQANRYSVMRRRCC